MNSHPEQEAKKSGLILVLRTIGYLIGIVLGIWTGIRAGYWIHLTDVKNIVWKGAGMETWLLVLIGLGIAVAVSAAVIFLTWFLTSNKLKLVLRIIGAVVTCAVAVVAIVFLCMGMKENTVIDIYMNGSFLGDIDYMAELVPGELMDEFTVESGMKAVEEPTFLVELETDMGYLDWYSWSVVESRAITEAEIDEVDHYFFKCAAQKEADAQAEAKGEEIAAHRTLRQIYADSGIKYSEAKLVTVEYQDAEGNYVPLELLLLKVGNSWKLGNIPVYS